MAAVRAPLEAKLNLDLRGFGLESQDLAELLPCPVAIGSPCATLVATIRQM